MVHLIKYASEVIQCPFEIILVLFPKKQFSEDALFIVIFAHFEKHQEENRFMNDSLINLLGIVIQKLFPQNGKNH